MGADLNCKNCIPSGDHDQLILTPDGASQKITNCLKTLKANNKLRSNLLDRVKNKISKSNVRVVTIPQEYFSQLLNRNAKAKTLIEKYAPEIEVTSDNPENGAQRSYKMNPLKFINNEDGSVEYYQGGFDVNGNFSGLGTHIFDNKFIYRGNFKDGNYEGKGLLITEEGNSLFGDWSKNECNGKAKLSIEGLLEYDGEFSHSKKTGFGVEKYADGSKYEGNFVDGIKNGKGKYTFANGEYYDGDYVNDKYEGEGIYEWPSEGRKYQGSFKGGAMNGHGVNYYQSGAKYEGNYVNGVKNGEGVFTWPNGKVFKGTWANDELNGQGTYEFNGEKYDVILRYGRIVSSRKAA